MPALPQHLDLHLIRILYLLLVEKNVSRVALKLNQPQPSISASLRKLRELTGDPLLVRGARGMVPTQHGESLLIPAKRILDETENLFLKKTPFIPQEEARTFHVAAPDYLDSQFLPNLVALLRRGSPNSRVKIHSLGPGVDYVRLLSDGDMDLVIANWDEPPQHLHISKLFEDPIICAMHAASPYARRTGSDATDDWQGRFVGLGFEARDANTARSTRGHLDRAFASEGLEVFLGGVGGLEPQFQRNFRSCRRVAVVVEAALDKSQNLSLAWRQF